MPDRPTIDRLETMLRSGAEQFAATVRPPAVEVIRARGNRRRQLAAAGSAALAVVALMAALAIAHAVIGASRMVVNPGPGLRLVVPSRYLAGIPNPVSFTVPGEGRPATVTVDVELGRPSYAVFSPPAILRRDPASGRWLQVRLDSSHGGWRGGYQVRVPAGDSVQHLLVVAAGVKSAPPYGAGRLRVRVLDGSRLLGSQVGRRVVLSNLFGSWLGVSSAPLSVPRGESRELSFELRNPVGVGFRVPLFIYAFLCPRSTCTTKPDGIDVQWLDAGRWRDLSAVAWATPGNGQLIETAWLPPHGRLAIRFRIVVSATGPSTTGELSMQAQLATTDFPGPHRIYGNPGWSIDSGIILTG